MDTGPQKSISINITASAIVKFFLVAIGLLFIFLIRDIVLVVLTAIVIASAIEPIIIFLRKIGLARPFAVIATYIILAAILVGLFFVFLPSLFNDLSSFLSNAPSYVDKISLWNPLSSANTEAGPIAETFSKTVFNRDAGPVSLAAPGAGSGKILELSALFNNLTGIGQVSEGVIQTVSFVFGGILSFVLIVVLSFYFSVQEDGIGSFLRIITPIRQESYVVSLWQRSQKKIGLWMQGQLLLGAMVGILVYLGLMILGIKNALLFAFIALIFEVIPIFGPILASFPPILTALAAGGLPSGLLVAGLFIIIQQFENHLIYPLVVKKIVGVPPILVILALIVGAELAGFLGVILSVPIAAVLVELLSDFEQRKVRLSGGARSNG